MPGVITPNELFFVRNNGGSLGIRETDWRLVIEGDAVEKGIEDFLRRNPYLAAAGR